MKRILINILICMTVLGLRAQTTIEGTVTDSLGKTVDAYITVQPLGAGGVVGFADTDARGYYSISFTSGADSLTVVAGGMGIGRKSRTVANRSQRVDFRMASSAIELKEVKVRAQKITESGDTLNYFVASYQQQGDRVIADVLKKMPGIEVADNGAIKFNGKAISKFYVEDMDLLQGRYGIATNNINASDVARVQVLQNHQPVKALQGKSLTDDVAINLKLKDSAKGTVAINTMLGGGWENPTPALPHGGGGFLVSSANGSNSNNGKSVVGSNHKTPSPVGEGRGGVALFSGEAVGMYFAKRRQNMSLYKGNNSGDDVSGELTSHYSSINSVGLHPFCPIGAVMPSGSGLPSKRTFDNRSHIVSMNHLEKIDSVQELTFNAAYHRDHVRREGTSACDIFLAEDSRLQTSETLSSLTKTNNLSTNLRYCKNATNGFLANVLKADAGWNSDEVDGLLSASSVQFGSIPSSRSSVQFGSVSSSRSSQAISQHFHRPTLSLSNTINTIQNFGRRTLDLHFSAGYARRANTLAVGIDSLEENVSHRYEQAVESQHIAANFHTNFSWRFGDFTLSYGIVADASLHGITTDLDGFTPPVSVPGDSIAGSTINDLWYNTYTLRLSQSYKWQHGRWQMVLGCPLELYTQTLDDRIRKNKRGYTNLLAIPSFTASYYYRDWSGSANVGYQRTVGDPGGIYDGYIMTGYRTFQRSFVDQLSETDRVSSDVKLGYRSAIHAFFFNFAASYTHTRDNQIYGYDYQGATSVVQAIDRATIADSYTLQAEANKGFDWLQSSLRLFGGYGDTQSERLVGGTVYAFHSRTASLGGGGTITPLPWMNFVLSSGYNWAWSMMQGGNSQKVRNATLRLKLNVFITKNLTLTATVEDNYNNLTATQKHAWFGDLTAKYKFKRVDLELEANNLFNQKTYTQTRYNGLDIFTTTTQLRPLNVLMKVRFKLL